MQQKKAPIAIALQLAYERAMSAREGVEHRLASIPPQQVLVHRWCNETAVTAAEEFPGMELDSYPVLTRMNAEITKLERYEIEIVDRAIKYEEAMTSLALVLNKIKSDDAYASLPEVKAVLKSYTLQLRDNPWPAEWPISIKNSTNGRTASKPITLTRYANLTAPPEPTMMPFNIFISGHQIELLTRYEEGIYCFEEQLTAFYENKTSSRWPAILEAIRCGIRWPQLDRYLDEADAPWLPSEFVNETFGLRGTLARRDELADLMQRVSQGAAHWYLTQHTGRGYMHDEDVNLDFIQELMSIGLILWGPDLAPAELLRGIPLPEVKFLFAIAGMAPPRSYNASVAAYDRLADAYGEEMLKAEIMKQVDATRIIDVLEPDGWHREERLGPRARANILVSSLIYLYEGHSGPLRILNWTCQN